MPIRKMFSRMEILFLLVNQLSSIRNCSQVSTVASSSMHLYLFFSAYPFLQKSQYIFHMISSASQRYLLWLFSLENPNYLKLIKVSEPIQLYHLLMYLTLCSVITALVDLAQMRQISWQDWQHSNKPNLKMELCLGQR